MSSLTDDQREVLQERLKELDQASAAIFVARKPFDEALAAINSVRERVLDEAGVEPLDEICETCERHLFAGDLGHRCADGPVLCEACSPTWNEIRAQFAKEEPDIDELFHSAVDIDDVDAHIAAGDGDKKHVWPL